MHDHIWIFVPQMIQMLCLAPRSILLISSLVQISITPFSVATRSLHFALAAKNRQLRLTTVIWVFKTTATTRIHTEQFQSSPIISKQLFQTKLSTGRYLQIIIIMTTSPQRIIKRLTAEDLTSKKPCHLWQVFDIVRNIKSMSHAFFALNWHFIQNDAAGL